MQGRRLQRLFASITEYYSSLGELRDRRLAVLALANLLDKASTSIVVPLLPIYAEQLGAGPIFLGLLFTLPTGASTLLSTPFGYLADRTARKPWIVAGMILGGVSVLGVGLAGDPMTLLLFRGLDGAAMAMRSAPTTAYLGDVSEEENRGSVMAAYHAAGMVSIAVGPVLGGTLATIGSLATPFLVLGGLTLLGGVVLVWLPRSDHDPTGEPVFDRVGFSGSLSSTRSAIGDVRKRPTPTVGALLVSGLLAQIGTAALSPLFAPLLTETVGGDPAAVSLAWSTLGVGILIFVPVGGTLADRAGRKRTSILGKGIWFAVTIGLVLAQTALLPVVLMALGGVASAFTGPAQAALRYESAPEGGEGSLIGLYGTAGSVGGTIGPLLGGAVAGMVGIRGAVLAIGVLWALDAVVIALGVRDRPKEERTTGQPADG
jgi:MFS family permease